MRAEENRRLMKTLDDAWNCEDWDTFDMRHAHNVAVYWPGQPEPTRGQRSHQQRLNNYLGRSLTTASGTALCSAFWRR